MGGTSPLGERDAQEILRQLPVALTVIDADGRLAYVNEEAARLFGTPSEDMVGQPAVSVTVAAVDTEVAVELSATVAAGGRWTGRFPITAPDGRRIEAWLAARAVAGEIVSVGLEAAELTSSLDLRRAETLTEQSRAEAEEANRLLTTLLDAVPIGMGFFDRNLRFVRANQALATINGLATVDHVGKSIADVLRHDPASVEDAVRQVFETGVVADRVVTDNDPHRHGAQRHWTVSYFPVRLRGEIAWVGTTVVEVTEWHEAARARAEMLEVEQDLRQKAEAVSGMIMRLQLITARLAEANSLDAVAAAVVENAPSALGATGAAVMVAQPGHDGGQDLRTVRAMGFDERAVAAFEVCSVDAALPVAEAARSREIVLIANREERDERWPALREVPTHSDAAAAVPLMVDDVLLGALTLGWAYAKEFSADDVHFIQAIGRQCSLALERVRLYEAERQARADAELATRRMAFLAEASRTLASALDYRATFPQLVRLAVKEVADVCTVHVFDEGQLVLGASAHRDATRSAALDEAVGRRPMQPRLIGRVGAGAGPMVIEKLDDQAIAAIAEDERHAELIRATGIESAILVPIRSGSEVLGVFGLGSCVPDGFSGLDLAFVDDVAARIAVALDTSRSTAARVEAIQTLQQSLLPPVAPDIPTLDLARRFHTASELDMGGDFFDVFPSGDGRWGVVMGDVCGRGVGAAALTALARYTVRAAAIDQSEPLEVLHLLNRAILETETGERFCTLTYTVVEPVDGGARLTLACGGHPLPLVLRAGGRVEEVGRPGTAIGMFEDLDLTAVDVELGPGDAIAFFTDGYTEARAPDGRFAPDLLANTLAAAAGGDAETLVSAIDRAVLAFEGGNPRDDMALLVVRVPG